MNKLKEAYMRKMTKSKMGNIKTLVADEKKYNERLKDVHFQEFGSLIKIFMKEFKKENLRKQYETLNEVQLVQMMFIAELDDMMTYKDEADDSITSIISMLKGNLPKSSLQKIKKKDNLIARICQENSF